MNTKEEILLAIKELVKNPTEWDSLILAEKLTPILDAIVNSIPEGGSSETLKVSGELVNDRFIAEDPSLYSQARFALNNNRAVELIVDGGDNVRSEFIIGTGEDIMITKSWIWGFPVNE